AARSGDRASVPVHALSSRPISPPPESPRAQPTSGCGGELRGIPECFGILVGAGRDAAGRGSLPLPALSRPERGPGPRPGVLAAGLEVPQEPDRRRSAASLAAPDRAQRAEGPRAPREAPAEDGGRPGLVRAHRGSRGRAGRVARGPPGAARR